MPNIMTLPLAAVCRGLLQEEKLLLYTCVHQQLISKWDLNIKVQNNML